MRSITFVTAAWVTVSYAAAQTAPQWWKYLPENSTSVVGIRLQTAQSTLFVPALRAELAHLGFPDLNILKSTEQLLISGPTHLIIAFGIFPNEKLPDQFTAAGFTKTSIGSVDAFAGPKITIARLSDQLLLIGTLAAIEEALTPHRFSLLASRGARYSQEDLWVVASGLPDPLASFFIPLDAEATAFEGSVSVWYGLHLVAAIEQSSSIKAEQLAGVLKRALHDRPALAEGTEITVRNRSVLVRIDLDQHQLAASTSPAQAQSQPSSPDSAPKAILNAPIRVLGLSEGTREIPFGR